MSALPNHLPLESLRGLCDDVELAILYDWLQIPRPAALAGIDLQRAFYDEEPTTGPIRLLPGPNGDIAEYTLTNAVARLVLSEIQHRLPQWAAVVGNQRTSAIAQQPLKGGPVPGLNAYRSVDRKATIMLPAEHLLLVSSNSKDFPPAVSGI